MTSRHVVNSQRQTIVASIIGHTAKKRTDDKLDDNPSKSNAPHIADNNDILYYNAIDKRRYNTHGCS